MPLSIIGPALSAMFPVAALAIGWWSGEDLSLAKLAVLAAACGLVVVATFMK